MLPARLRLDGTEANDSWANHQVDGIGTWLWSLQQHLIRTGEEAVSWRGAIEVAVDYLLAVGTQPCFDWWEEEPPGVHPSTLACVAAGLRAAGELGVLDTTRLSAVRTETAGITGLLIDSAQGLGYLPKTVGVNAIDAAVIAGVGPLKVVGGSLALATLGTVEARLVEGSRVYRFEADRYYGGGPWPLLSAMLGLAWLEYGNVERARDLLEWAVSTEDIRGWIPEQGRGRLLHGDGLLEWEQRWGKSATPLLWSSAMVLRLIVSLRSFS
jgi:GH15 family glucan-1,4-alpha-glucosidase